MWLQQRVPSPSCGMTMDKLLIFSDVSLNSPSCKIRRKKIAPTLQAFLRDTVGSVPDTHSEARLPRWCYWSWACLPMGCEMWGDVGLIPGLWDVGSIPGSGRFPWRSKWQPTPEFLPGESHGQRSLAGYSPWFAKSRTQLKWLNTHNKANIAIKRVTWIFWFPSAYKIYVYTIL